MIARAADHCFWFGRYIERTESTARVLQATGSLALDAELRAVVAEREQVELDWLAAAELAES